MITEEECAKYVEEFKEHNGRVTIEFSVHKDTLEDTFKVLNNHKSTLGKWIALSCKTCEEYYGKGYVHVSLEPESILTGMLTASNFLIVQED